MEKVDVAIAVAGVVVLATAIAGSALYGGTGPGLDAATVTFPESQTDLEPQSAQRTGSGEQEFTFTLTQPNVTRLDFEASGSTAAGGPTNPDVTVTVTSPTGATYEGDGNLVTIPLATPPEPYSGALGDAPAPDTTHTGDWIVTVTVSGSTPLPTPYTVDVTGVVTHYAATAA